MICTFCGLDHSWLYCRTKPEGWKPPKKSTAARKDVHGTVRMTPGDAPQPEPQDRIGGSGNDPQAVCSPAGTQAPPVDTKPKFNKVAYQRQYMRDRRARQKVEK